MQGHLREALGLQVGDDGLPTKGAAFDHFQHLLKLVLQQRQLEHVLCCVNLQEEQVSYVSQHTHYISCRCCIQTIPMGGTAIRWNAFANAGDQDEYECTACARPCVLAAHNASDF